MAATKAPAKPKTKGTAVAVRKPTAVVSVEEMQAAIKKSIQEVAETTGSPSGDQIRVGQDKLFKLPDGTSHPGPIPLIIVDHVTLREFYDRPFNKANPCPPACAAVGRKPTEMAPFKNVPDRQSDNCTGCPMNEWETADQGKGKACKENRHLAVIPPDAVDGSNMALLDVSPTGLKAYDSYARSVANALQLPLWAVVTEVSFDPNSEYPSLRFGNPMPATEQQKAVAYSLMAQARDRLLAVPDFSGYTKPQAKGKRR